MRTWKDLIERFGGPHRFAETLGIEHATARQMASRNSVHSDYWQLIVARAPQAGVQGVTYELLATLEKGRSAKSGAQFLQRRTVRHESQVTA